MLAFTFYLLKVIICSGILFGYYWFMLRNKIFHQYNRFYLLAAVFSAIVLPLVQINIWHNADKPAPEAIKLLQVVSGSSEYLDEIIVTARQTNFTTEQALFLLYSVTTFVFLGLFVHALIRIRILFIKHQHSFVQNIFFVNTTAKGTPFSFLKYIFWNDHIDPESSTGNQVFRHELAHVQQKHSYDKLFMNVVLIFFWCNPFFWLMRKELNMIHEFVADKIALEDSDTGAFAAMILQVAYPQHRFPLTNPYFYSPIKRRLMMLTKNRNSKVGYIGRLMVLPLTVLIFAAFTLKAKTFKQNTESYNGKTIRVVIDAGHGGDDKGALNLAGNITEKDLTLSIVKKIRSLNNNDNINIILTRETDVYQSPKEKAGFAASEQADLFISIHTDATSKEAADLFSGMSVWVSKDNYANSNNSKLFASAIINAFANNYKLPVSMHPQQRQPGIAVLQQNQCPSVLIEAGYITNNKDAAYLQTEEAKESIAKNILMAIEKYAVVKEKGEAVIINPVTFPAKNPGAEKTDTIPKITLTDQNKALIIVDGNTISHAELKNIKPENIESVNVIKGKEAIAKYGDKGKNGVVLVTTKIQERVLNNVNISVVQDTTVKQENKLLSNITIRNEKNSALKPLYVINGKEEANEFNLNSISANDIERINILKDKSAIDKYGDKAINGVIEITTKNTIDIKEITLNDNAKNNEIKNVIVTGNASNYNQQERQNEPVFTKVEYEPTFPGGDSAWRNYLIKNLNAGIPVAEGWKAGVYKIVISFIVKKDGTVTDIKTDDFAGSKTAAHCIDLISKGPRWNPAIQNGHEVNCYKKQPITFVVNGKSLL